MGVGTQLSAARIPGGKRQTWKKQVDGAGSCTPKQLLPRGCQPVGLFLVQAVSHLQTLGFLANSILHLQAWLFKLISHQDRQHHAWNGMGGNPTEE